MKKTMAVAAVLLMANLAVAETKTPAENLSRLLMEMSSYSADFQQFSQSASSDRVQVSEGNAKLHRPGMFHWVTLEPFPQEIVSDGETIWLYDPDLEQVTQKSVDANLRSSPALLLSGDASLLAETYSVTGPTTGDGLFTLTAKTEQGMIEQMSLFFQQDTLHQLQLTDSLGQQTRIAFRNVQLNPWIPLDRFAFEVPDGVDIIRK